MTLAEVWFVIAAIFWAGFFVLEGFDFGVGMLHPFIGRTDAERAVVVETIGPVWDGNEVWLIVAAAILFAAFPAWYATMFSAMYLAMLVILLGLMARGVSFEYSHRADDPRWRATWRWALAIGSAIVPFLLGLAFGDLLHGLPIDSSHNFTGNFGDLFTGYGIWTGLTFVALSLLMGVTFLSLKTTGHLHDRAQRWAMQIGILATVVTFGFMTWTHVGLATGFVPKPIEALALLSVFGAAVAASTRADGWAFLAAAVGMAGTIGTIFSELYPRLMVSSTSSANNLTIANSASPSYTLKVMTVIAAVSVPVVLAYQAWSYHIFRKRLTAPPATTADAGAESREDTPA